MTREAVARGRRSGAAVSQAADSGAESGGLERKFAVARGASEPRPQSSRRDDQGAAPRRRTAHAHDHRWRGSVSDSACVPGKLCRCAGSTTERGKGGRKEGRKEEASGSK